MVTLPLSHPTHAGLGEALGLGEEGEEGVEVTPEMMREAVRLESSSVTGTTS